MTIKSFETRDSLLRCVLCDAPVGVNNNSVFTLMGEPYCEYCGVDICPFCGESKEIEPPETSCKATDVNFYDMHHGAIEIPEEYLD